MCLERLIQNMRCKTIGAGKQWYKYIRAVNLNHVSKLLVHSIPRNSFGETNLATLVLRIAHLVNVIDIS